METTFGAKRNAGARARIILLGTFLGLMALGADGRAQTPLVGEIGHPTSTSLTASPSSSTYGQTVEFEALVGVAGSNTPAVTVLFQDSGVTIGSIALTAIEGTVTSEATFSTNSLPAGPHSITAAYQGNGANMASSSPALPFTVGKAATYFSAFDGGGTISVGQYIGLQALIHFPGTIPPSGTVLFADANRNITIGSATVQSSPGNAEVDLSTDSLNAGTYSVTATYQGDANYLPCTSGTLPFTVSQGSAAFTLTPSNNPSSVGQPVTFIAHDNSNGAPSPSGSVTFKDGATTLGSGTLTLGQANFTSSALSAGTHSITVMYGGDSNYTGSTSAALTQTVSSAKTTGTQTTVASSLNPSIIGQPVTFTATVSGSGSGTPTGTVNFKDGGTVVDTATLVDGSASFMDQSLTAGAHSITVVYSGDSNYSGSTSGTLTENVYSSNGPTTTSLVSSANPSRPGESVTFTATVHPSGPGTPTGIVTFWDGSTELGSFALNGNSASLSTSSLALGAHSITAGYGGDIVFSPSTSAVLTQTVSTGPSATSTLVGSSSDPSTFGQSVTFTAAVSSSGAGTPSGSVTFKDGASTLGSGTLSNARTSFTTSALSVGTHSITAVYGGDSNFTGSTSNTLPQSVNAGSTGATATVVVSSANPSAVGQAVTFSASVTASGSGTPSGTVTFEDGTSTLGTSSLSGGRASLTTSSLAQGQHSITAVYGGDSSFTGSTSAVLTQTVQSATSSGSNGALAHFAAGSTWTTGIFVVNTADQAGQFSIAFHGDDGSPATLPFSTGATSTLEGSIPANGSAYFEASDPQGALISGWGSITADPSIVVQALFRNDSNGMYFEAAVPSSSGSHEFMLPFDATTFAGNGQPFYTGFAIANLDPTSATVSCIARDSAGSVIANGVPVPALSPLGHWANYQFPALTGQRGTMDCSSNTNIAGIALRFIGTNAFSSLPVVYDPSTFSGGSQADLADRKSVV